MASSVVECPVLDTNGMHMNVSFGICFPMTFLILSALKQVLPPSTKIETYHSCVCVPVFFLSEHRDD